MVETELDGRPNEGLPRQEVVKMRFDYAWRWFDFHAKQRVSMFNYFLIITGIFASAFVGAIRDSSFGISATVSTLGFITSIVFYLLDCRNKELVDMGEDVLLKIEEDELFKESYMVKHKDKKKAACLQQGGFMVREYTEEPRKGWSKVTKHKYLIRFLEIVVGICFILGFLYSINALRLR